jgi:hypothetical protein
VKDKASLEKIIHQLQREREDNLRELNKKEHKIATLSAHIDELTQKLNQRTSLRAQARSLYNEIDSRIITTLTVRGTPKKKPVRAHPALQFDDNGDIKSLRSIAYRYDIENFFAYRPKQEKPRLTQPYRTIAKAYRVGRDVSRKTAAGVLRAAKRVKQ